jgi:squalene synthase HpnC
VRTADDVADHATLPAADKLAYLDLLEAELTGEGDSQKEAVALRAALAERGMPPRHALDLLTAFRMDVTKLRYENWDDLIHYCRYSAMPVGRFVLDVHGESTSTWAANDALCAALQINNHLQDCGKDYRQINRVYLPRDALQSAGATVEMLGANASSPQLLQCLHALAARNQRLLEESRSFSAEVKDFRLGLEISVIHAFADKIVRLLQARDPLSERVHLSPLELLAKSLGGMAGETARRAIGRRPASKTAAGA